MSRCYIPLSSSGNEIGGTRDFYCSADKVVVVVTVARGTFALLPIKFSSTSREDKFVEPALAPNP
jgi:hypothetical protein